MRVNIEGCTEIELLRKVALRLQMVAESQGDTIHALRKENERLMESLKSGGASDGYHTFNELYEHRHVLFAALVADIDDSWKSKKHHDGTMFDGGWFIAGIELHTGTITYHIPLRLWDLFLCKELEFAPEWDGHTSDDVIKRIEQALGGEDE